MRRPMLIAGATVMLVFGSASAQQVQRTGTEQQIRECETRVTELGGKQGDIFGEFEVVPPALLDLRSAARRTIAQDLGGACLRIVEAMEVAVEEYQRTGTTTVPARQQRPAMSEDEIEARVVPMSDIELDTSAAEDAEVYNYDHEKLGEVEGLLFDGGRPSHLVVEHGGFWVLKPRTAAIPVELVRWDPEWEAFFAPLTEAILKEAPAFAGDGDVLWDPTENDRYFADGTD